MSIHYRSALGIALCACALTFPATTSHAFMLNRIAAALDISRVASAGATRTDAVDSDVHHAVTPPAAELIDASTEIEVHVAVECDVDIQVVDEAGQRVCGARVHMPAGAHKLGFCGRDARGRSLPNGVYFYNVIVGNDVRTTRVTIAR